MRKRSDSSDLLKKIRKIILHEGRKYVLVREDGSMNEITLKKAEVKLTILNEYITAGNQEKISEIVSEAAEELKNKITKGVYDSISDTIDSSGNVINVKGMPLNPDHIYELFEKIQLDFDKNGNIQDGFEIHCHPDSKEAMMRVSREIESDPIQKQRFDELLARKREEWRVRESNRKLVG